MPASIMNKDLKSRIPAAILYVLGIAAMTLAGVYTTIVLLIIFFGLCVNEFVNGGKVSHSGVTIYIYGFSILLILFSLSPLFVYLEVEILMYTTSLVLMVNAIYLILKKITFLTRLPISISVLLYLALPFLSTIKMSLTYERFPIVLLGVFIILWLNDAGAYFVGKQFGRNKLFPSISPSKTWEGLIGGGVVGLLTSLCLSNILQIFDIQIWVVLSLIIWMMGALGDLVESSWKRQMGLKDSGTLMRGHGGFLDRLDSFIYAIPFVSLYLIYFIEKSSL